MSFRKISTALTLLVPNFMIRSVRNGNHWAKKFQTAVEASPALAWRASPILVEG